MMVVNVRSGQMLQIAYTFRSIFNVVLFFFNGGQSSTSHALCYATEEIEPNTFTNFLSISRKTKYLQIRYRLYV